MKAILTLLISTTLLFRGVAADRAQAKNCQVYFSPHGGCTEAVVGVLAKARANVLVQAYSFTSAPIAKALVEAHRRGVKVAVVL
jgi:phosphatidylserine/phosphatidylglycerophosphate/cardiolipin synthase-like enzyme